MRSQERRSDIARRRRIDELLERVDAAREEIVEVGLGAVHDSPAADGKRPGGRFARAPKTGAHAGTGPVRRTRDD